MEHPAIIDAECCTGCMQCRLVCPFRAIDAERVRCRIRADDCRRCEKCLWVCPSRCITEADPRLVGSVPCTSSC